MVASFETDININVEYAGPIWSPDNVAVGAIRYDGYAHNINAVGGYWSAEIKFSARQDFAEDWYTNGLGRDICVSNLSLAEIWNGFVNEIEVQIGTLTATRGPLIDVSNRVDLVYSTVDTTTDPPVVGMRENTGVSNDTDSQAIYGIIEKILSTGGATQTTAEQIRDTYLEENKDPETSQRITIGESSEPVVTLKCLGYVHWLELYTYTSTTTGTRAYNTRIQDALAADPNSIFSTDYSGLTANAATVPRYDNDDRTGWQVIKGIISKGDTSYNRYTFGIYQNRKAYYDVVPSNIEYYHKLSDNRQRIERLDGVEIKPWDVLPARWLQISDWLIGRLPPTSDLRSDPRNMFIESVQYTAPYGLSISGNKINTLPQILGQLGLTGIGA